MEQAPEKVLLDGVGPGEERAEGHRSFARRSFSGQAGERGERSMTSPTVNAAVGAGATSAAAAIAR